ncbi:MAG TPA: hypothetical protein VK466_12155 [Terriglobales bacterium]|nr:hypothetical protein [Terriglobales bacterium]
MEFSGTGREINELAAPGKPRFATLRWPGVRLQGDADRRDGDRVFIQDGDGESCGLGYSNPPG